MDAVLAELSVAQLAEWQAYYMVEPFGGDWHRSAMLASVLAEVNRNKDEKPEPFTVEDFLPRALVPEPDPDEDADEVDVMAEDAPWRAWKAAMQALADASSP